MLHFNTVEKPEAIDAKTFVSTMHAKLAKANEKAEANAKDSSDTESYDYKSLATNKERDTFCVVTFKMPLERSLVLTGDAEYSHVVSGLRVAMQEEARKHCGIRKVSDATIAKSAMAILAERAGMSEAEFAKSILTS